MLWCLFALPLFGPDELFIPKFRENGCRRVAKEAFEIKKDNLQKRLNKGGVSALEEQKTDIHQKTIVLTVLLDCLHNS